MLSREKAHFLALRFGTNYQLLKKQYDFDSYWNFEVKVKSETYVENSRIFKIKRDKEKGLAPDIDWRIAHFSKYRF